MNGLELSRAFYEQHGKPMLESQFPALLPLLAIGFVGNGSEKSGFDDAVSADHDYEAGFCIFLPGEELVSRRDAFLLERAYAKLPREFMGVTRPILSPVGGNRVGPIRTAEFYEKAVGAPDGRLSTEQWLRIPDYALYDATNGQVFSDPFGEFSRIRENLLSMPGDIRLKRLAGQLLLIAQSGPYNYVRCLAHSEPEAAQLAKAEFVRAAMQCLFLLKKCYMPYYKWSFRALRAIPGMEEETAILSQILLSSDDCRESVNTFCRLISSRVRALFPALPATDDPEPVAYAVNGLIKDSEIRNLHILYAV